MFRPVVELPWGLDRGRLECVVRDYGAPLAGQSASIERETLAMLSDNADYIFTVIEDFARDDPPPAYDDEQTYGLVGLDWDDDPWTAHVWGENVREPSTNRHQHFLKRIQVEFEVKNFGFAVFINREGLRAVEVTRPSGDFILYQGEFAFFGYKVVEDNTPITLPTSYEFDSDATHIELSEAMPSQVDVARRVASVIPFDKKILEWEEVL